jgi:hypothetical protein
LVELETYTKNKFVETYNSIDQTQRLRKRDKSDHLVEFKNLNNKLQSCLENNEMLADGINNVGEMMACLIEAIKIEQALSIQDEEDRKAISL